MIMRILAVLVVFSIVGTSQLLGQTRTNEEIAMTRKAAVKISSDKKQKAEVRLLSGEKLKGRIDSVDSFTFTDKNSGKTRTIAFSEVKDLTNNRLGAGTWIVIGGLAAAGVIALAFLVTRCNNEGGC